MKSIGRYSFLALQHLFGHGKDGRRVPVVREAPCADDKEDEQPDKSTSFRHTRSKFGMCGFDLNGSVGRMFHNASKTAL